jgi:hypothetical protein
VKTNEKLLVERAANRKDLNLSGRKVALELALIDAHLKHKDTLPTRIQLTERWHAVINSVSRKGHDLQVDLLVLDDSTPVDELRFPRGMYPMFFNSPPIMVGDLEDIPRAFENMLRQRLLPMVRHWYKHNPKATRTRKIKG